MLNRIYRALFTVQHRYEDVIQQQRAALLLRLGWLVVAAWALWSVLFLVPELAASVSGLGPAPLIPLLVVPVIFFAIFALVQTGRLRLAIWLFILGISLGVFDTMADQFDPLQPITLSSVLIFIPLAIAAFLLERWGLVIVFALTLAMIGSRALEQTEAIVPLLYVPSDTALIDTFLLVSVAGLMAAFAYAFGGSTLQAVRLMTTQNQLLRETAAFLSNIPRHAVEEDVLDHALDLVQQYYPVCQIFLANDSGQLSRRVRSGLSRRESGVSMTLRPSDVAVISDVARLREPLFINSADERRAHLIPPSQSALLLPILYDDRLVGVFDIQSNRDHFTGDERAAFALLAGQVGVAFMNARMTADLTRALHEQEEVSSRLKQQLAGSRLSSGAALNLDWQGYLKERSAAALGFDFQRNGGSAIIPARDLSDELRSVLEQGEVFVETTEREQIINLPIRLRDEILGAMTFSVPPDRPITVRQLDMAKTVAERLALALENTRLFEQSQLQAERERKASEIANTLLGSTDIEAVMEQAAQSFNEALGAVSTRIYLKPRQLISEGEEI